MFFFGKIFPLIHFRKLHILSSTGNTILTKQSLQKDFKRIQHHPEAKRYILLFLFLSPFEIRGGHCVIPVRIANRGRKLPFPLDCHCEGKQYPGKKLRLAETCTRADIADKAAKDRYFGTERTHRKIKIICICMVNTELLYLTSKGSCRYSRVIDVV